IKAFKNVNDYDTLVKTFENMYTRVYAKCDLSPELGYSITGAIVRRIVDVPLPKIPKETLSEETPPKEALLGALSIDWDGEWLEADNYEMEKLLPGNKLGAFSIIESTATTLVVPTGFETYLDENRIFH